MSDAVVGFFGVLIGAMIAGAVTLLGEQVALRREREARQDERERQQQDRRDTFELDTLLALQDAVSKMRLAVHADYERKIGIMAEQGAWPVRSVDMLLPEDWAEADDHLIRLHARVFDDEVQMLIEHFRDASRYAMTAEDQSTAYGQGGQVSIRLEEINARIGMLLSRLH